MTEMVRTHLVLPAELLERFDRRVGPRKRSEKVAELVEEFLRREQLIDTIERFAGFAKAEDHPEWSSEDAIARWVRDERRNSDRTFDRTESHDDLSA